MTIDVAMMSLLKSPTESVILIVAGVASSLVAVLNQHFQWRKGWFSGDKPAPTLVSRLMFGAVGLLFVVVGVRDLWFSN
jgi:hypothetical protein